MGRPYLGFYGPVESWWHPTGGNQSVIQSDDKNAADKHLQVLDMEKLHKYSTKNTEGRIVRELYKGVVWKQAEQSRKTGSDRVTKQALLHWSVEGSQWYAARVKATNMVLFFP